MNNKDYQLLFGAELPLTIKAKRREIVVMMSAWALVLINAATTKDILGICLSLCAVLWGAKLLMDPAAGGIVLDKKWFLTNRFGLLRRKVLWENVSDIMERKNGIVALKMRKARLVRHILGADYHFLNLYDIDTPHLVQLMNHCRERALGHTE